MFLITLKLINIIYDVGFTFHRKKNNLLTVYLLEKCKENKFQFDNFRNCQVNGLQFKSCGHDLTCAKKKEYLPPALYMSILEYTTWDMPPFLYVRGNQESVLSGAN